MNKNEKQSYHDVTIEHLFGKFKSSKDGLKDADAAERIREYGLNILPGNNAFSATRLFLKQFQSPLIYILIFAMILSFAMKHVSDGMIIALVVFITSVVGFIQEFKANRALENLNSIISLKAHVWRGGERIIIGQENIVPGDVIELRSGDIVPADARLFEAQNLQISEAVLTGEPEAAEKILKNLPLDTPLAERDNMVFKGTLVNDGIGRAIVVATGAATEVGKIADLLKKEESGLTPLQKQINDFGKWLSYFLIAANLGIFIIGVLMGRSIFDMFMIAVVVVVAAIPEEMVPAMSIVLALGMQKLIKKKGLVRKIISAETLGSVSIICTDKTGTLTEGNMSVNSIITLDGAADIVKNARPDDLTHALALTLKIGVLSNNITMDEGNPVGNMTEKALYEAGANYGLFRAELEKSEKRLAELPFTSLTKIMATLHGTASGNIIYVKGAPERIIPLSSKILSGKKEIRIDAANTARIHETIGDLTNAGQRVLAVAYKKTGSTSLNKEEISELVFVGLIAIKDKIRSDAKKSIKLCQEAGIKVAMITGDHANTAKAIAKELGIKADEEQIIEGRDIDTLDDEILKKRIKNTVIYARVEPSHKIRIVSLLQELGEVVAMTGDGINDAPALKKADIGVVMGSGTDVAKEVADLVLLDSSFMTVVEAVKQGRNTFNNIRKVIIYIFTDCFQEMIIIGTAVVAGWPLPLLPAQILWIKLIESPLPASSLSFEESEKNVLKEKPRHRNEPLLTKKIKFNIAFYAVVMDVIAISLFYWHWKSTGDLDKSRTIMFVALGLSTLFNIYNVRSLGRSVFRTNPFKNRYLTASTAIGFLLFIIAIYNETMNDILQTVPLNWNEWGIIMLYATASLFVYDLGKKIVGYKY